MELARFSLWHQGDHRSILRDTQILCIGYAIDNAKPLVLWTGENEREALGQFVDLLKEVDLLVHHNGNSFDWKVFNARLAFHRLPPAPPVLKYDTRLAAKRLFRFTSTRLDYLGDHLGFGRKSGHEGLDMWLKVMRGDQKAIASMTKYCARDVDLLRKVYRAVSPYDSNHPAIRTTGDSCTYCGSRHIQWQGYRRTAKKQYRRFQCQTCGKWGSE